MDNQPQKTGYKKELYTESARKDRFKRIAERRTNKILNSLRLLGNTGNKTLYLYTEDDVQRIFNAIDTKLAEIKGRFKTRKDDEKFRL
jgi:hypothetical protein